MTDHELLEMAAKAAGIADGDVFYDMDNDKEWDPLIDDALALRLGAALRLHILHNDPGDSVLWVSAVLNKRGIHGAVEFQDEVQRADATSRAIVLASAAIGRAMP